MNEFWLILHRLAEAYRAEGMTADERLSRILAHFEQMPDVARREILSDLALIAYNLSDVYVAAASRRRTLEEAAAPTPRQATG